MASWYTGILIPVLLICTITDIKRRIIPNKVIIPALGLAAASHFLLGGVGGLVQSALGFAVGLSLLLIPYLAGGMGAGDVKLLALVGALEGVRFVLAASAAMAILGALIAVAVLLARQGAIVRLRYLSAVLYAGRYGVRLPLGLSRGSFSATYPYGVAIAGGCALVLLGRWWPL